MNDLFVKHEKELKQFRKYKGNKMKLLSAFVLLVILSASCFAEEKLPNQASPIQNQSASAVKDSSYSFFDTSKRIMVAQSCGFMPFPPFGCTNANAVCSCDSHGNCSWMWVGCK